MNLWVRLAAAACIVSAYALIMIAACAWDRRLGIVVGLVIVVAELLALAWSLVDASHALSSTQPREPRDIPK